MCGIAGLVWKTPFDDSRALLDTIDRCLAHRGPDGRGFLQWRDGESPLVGREPVDVGGCRVAMAHRRLAVFDPSPASNQPMSTADGRYHLIFNGAIYNYVELRAELESAGRQFHTTGDSEVLLQALAEWGPPAVKKLIGMFAFALLDVRERTLLLVRDPLGIKPLYYVHTPEFLAFASEQTALLSLSGVDRRVNPQRLYDYLRFGLTDHGGETMVASIRQVEPATRLTVPIDEPTTTATEVYWSPDLDVRSPLSFDAAAERLRELLIESIRLHLRSDVPLAAALSGGIDSSAIVCTMRLVAGSAAELRGLNYRAGRDDIDEHRYAETAAAAAGVALHTIDATAEELAAEVDALIDAQSEPFGSTSIFAQRRVFQAAREQGLKVMLDGQGGDELLGGYRYFIACRAASLLRRGRWMQAARLLSQAARLPKSGNTPLAALHALGLLLPPRWRGGALRAIGEPLMPAWLDADWFSRRGVTPRTPRQPRGPRFLSEQLWNSIRETSLPALLRYEDRNSMAFGIESRVPLLTTALVEFVLSLPESFLVGPDATSKRLLRRALVGMVPEEILDRRDKIGFATPEKEWLLAMRPWVEQTLESQTAAAIGAWRPTVMREQWQALVEGRRRFNFRFWRWVNLIRWVERRRIVVD